MWGEIIFFSGQVGESWDCESWQILGIENIVRLTIAITCLARMKVRIVIRVPGALCLVPVSGGMGCTENVIYYIFHYVFSLFVCKAWPACGFGDAPCPLRVVKLQAETLMLKHKSRSQLILRQTFSVVLLSQ